MENLAPGRELGHYRLAEKIGEGGMGVVWRATDTTLGRDVAIKVLPDMLADDAERLGRFEREAKLLASLNHPNVAVVHGLHTADGVRFLVMELVPGDDLAQRLERGAIPVDEALEVARQLAEALDAAHEQGVIHRDLKPANIKLTADGQVKVLDFGLAKAFDPDPIASGSAPTMSPTLTSGGTAVGVILGTAAYMSPEQARGYPVDKRADIWAFGGVLYEMLTGTKAFAGETVTDTLAAVLKVEPDPAALPRETPESVRRLLARCLEKNPKRRLRDIGDARIVIEEASSAPAIESAPAGAPRGSARLAWSVAGLLAVVAVFSGLVALRQPAVAPREAIRFDIAPPRGMLLRSMYEAGAPVAISPDGRHLVFGVMGGDGGGGNRLWLRTLDSVPRPLPGTENGSRPFWSPDSRNIGFFTTNELRRIDIEGGPALTVCAVAAGRGASWNDEGTILLAAASDEALVRVPADGGDPQPVTVLGDSPLETSHRYPHFLPDGRHFIYLALGGAGAIGAAAESTIRVMLGSLDGDEPRLLVQGASNTVYAAGHLVYRRGKALRARPFDPDRLEFTGEARTLADAVHYDSAYERAIFSASDRLLAYVGGDFSGELQPQLLDRSGTLVRAIVGEVPEYEPRYSPDGRSLAVRGIDSQGEQVWIVDLERDVHTRLTFEEGFQGWPNWSPDGKSIAYGNTDGRSWHTRIRRADGTDEPRVLTEESADLYPVAWSPDGKTIVLGTWSNEKGYDLWIVDVEEGSEPRPLLDGPSGETLPAISPDGRFMAYTSNESGRPEVYVTRFPSTEGKWQVSGDGGIEPIWDIDGKALIYRSTSHSLMEVPLTIADSQPRFGSARKLFDVYFSSDLETKAVDLSPDGKQFVTSVISEEHMLAPITVVVDWAEAR